MWNYGEEDQLIIKKGLEKIFLRLVGSGLLDSQQKEAILSRIQFAKEMIGLEKPELIIEALPEELEPKKKLLADVSLVVKEDALLATTTSCYLVAEIAQAAKNPQRVLGMHFIPPFETNKLVEIVRTEKASEQYVNLANEFCGKIGKETVTVKDSPGFIVNYLFVPYINQALNYYDCKLADRETLDTVIQMGLGYPKGPLALIDELGLDSHLKICIELYERLKDPRFAPPPILMRMVAEGKLGRKSGRGFYSYEE